MINTELFTVEVHCVIFGTNIQANKKYVLSIDNNEIVFPKFRLSSSILTDFDKNLLTFVKQYVFVNDIYLLPQIINIHSPILSSENNTLNIIYGFIIEHTTNIDKSFWIEFDFLKPIPQSPLLYEVIQKLQ